MKLYAIRHGQTDWNLEQRAQGQTDIELNETGIKQALQAKEAIKSLKIDLIISSPLKRAYKTAEIISNGKIEITTDARLMERCFGKFEGTKTDIMPWEDLYNCEKNLSYDDIEPVNDLIKRCKNFLIEINEKHSNKTILIVTHGGTLRAINACINGIPENKTLAGPFCGNCELVEYNI